MARIVTHIWCVSFCSATLSVPSLSVWKGAGKVVFFFFCEVFSFC